MPRKTPTYLDFIITSSGFVPNFPEDIPDPSAKALASRFLENKFGSLYDISFRDPQEWYSPSLLYLHKVGSSFINTLCRTPDLETLRGSRSPMRNPPTSGGSPHRCRSSRDPNS